MDGWALNLYMKITTKLERHKLIVSKQFKTNYKIDNR